MDPGAPGSDRPGAGAAGPIELAAETLAQLFAEARTFSHFVPRPIPLDLLKRMYELAEWGPTSANSLPARFVFVVSSAAKERLRPVLSSGNVAKTMAAPATVIVAYDSRFYESLALTNPRSAARATFERDAAVATENAFRNGSLQGAYLILAARALGLDCGPMSGFDAARLDAEFFSDGRWRSNFLINLGYGDRSTLHPRNPRLAFEDACRIL
jgi:3-hydroxypropanoate dehydrogenase